METLKIIFKQLFTSGDWKYYEDMHFPTFPFENENEAARFVNAYFETGGKGSAMDPNINIENFRNIHTLSTFFLGIFLQELLPDRNEIKPKFKYVWYLSCLYHDYGYYIENNKVNYPPRELFITNIKEKLNIKYDLLKIGNTEPHSCDIVKQYYKYCRKERDVLNHGILGGILIYDRLRKNFEKAMEVAQREARAKSIPFNRNDFEYKNLHWSEGHFDWYEQIASIIIAHNIWFCTDLKDVAVYEKYELQDLNIIDRPDKKLRIESNTLLFLLCLVDTIEPTKHFYLLKPLCVLDRIQINFDKVNRIISLKVIDDCLDYDSWFKKIKSLEKWLVVEVRVILNTIEIRIR